MYGVRDTSRCKLDRRKGHQKDIGPKRKKKEKMSEIQLTQQKPSVALVRPNMSKSERFKSPVPSGDLM